MILHRLVKEATCSQVEAFLRESASVLSPSDLANALSAAVMRGDVVIIKALLDFGANPNSYPSEHLPPIHCAIEQQDKTILLLLVKYGADVNCPSEDGFSPLHRAVDIEGDSAWQKGEIPSGELTALLLDLGANPSANDASGRTPLSIAQQYQHHRAIELLTGRD